jgi:hypothetical protein
MALLYSSISHSTVIYTYEIENVNQKDEGVYRVLLDELKERLKGTVESTFFPTRRALKTFKENKDSCYFPTYQELFENYGYKDSLIFSKPLTRVEYYLVGRKSTPLPQTINDLEGFSIAVKPFDIPHGTLSFPNTKIFFVAKLMQQLMMLEKGRVDYIVVPVPDVFTGIDGGKKEFKKKYHYNKNLVVFSVQDRLVCHDSPEGQKIIKAFEALIL